MLSSLENHMSARRFTISSTRVTCLSGMNTLMKDREVSRTCCLDIRVAKEMPWEPATPQVEGRKAERQWAKDRGARLHPNSGAGPEKNDFSTEDTVFEAKNVAKTHTIKGSDLEKLFVGAS